MKITDALPIAVSMIALVYSILSFKLSGRVSTSDFQATQKVKLETATLIAALRSMMIKGAVYSQQDGVERKKKDYARYVDLTAEKKVVQDFLCSPTSIAYYSYLTDRSKRAAESAEEWRTFFLQAAELLSEDNQYAAAKKAAGLEKLFHPLGAADYIGISGNLQNLSMALEQLFASIPHDTLISAMMAASEPEVGDEEFRQFIFFLKKEKMVADADVDLFYGVFVNDKSILEDAISRGANVATTSGQIIERFRHLLSEFRLSKKK